MTEGQGEGHECQPGGGGHLIGTQAIKTKKVMGWDGGLYQFLLISSTLMPRIFDVLYYFRFSYDAVCNIL